MPIDTAGFIAAVAIVIINKQILNYGAFSNFFLCCLFCAGLLSFIITYMRGRRIYGRNVSAYMRALSGLNVSPDARITGLDPQVLKNLKAMVPFTEPRLYTRYKFSGNYIALDELERVVEVSAGMSVEQFIGAALKAGVKPIKIGNASYKIGRTTFYFDSDQLTEKEENHRYRGCLVGQRILSHCRKTRRAIRRSARGARANRGMAILHRSAEQQTDSVIGCEDVPVPSNAML